MENPLALAWYCYCVGVSMSKCCCWCGLLPSGVGNDKLERGAIEKHTNRHNLLMANISAVREKVEKGWDNAFDS